MLEHRNITTIQQAAPKTGKPQHGF